MPLLAVLPAVPVRAAGESSKLKRDSRKAAGSMFGGVDRACRHLLDRTLDTDIVSSLCAWENLPEPGVSASRPCVEKL